ncbi:E1-E2 ATPase-like protein 2 [Elsinoe fawcettii]|nr:E1-E2 ATPase-like protein 2 [Elsinoe fawcettii]
MPPDDDHHPVVSSHLADGLPGPTRVTNESVPPASNPRCCGKTSTNQAVPDHNTLCRLTAGDDCAPSCCEKDDGPRCDDDCIKAYATLECHISSHADPEHQQPTDGHCTNHLQAAIKRYEQLLEDAHCLCKSVLSYSMIHCCGSDAGYMLLPPIPSSRGSSETGSFRSSLYRRTASKVRPAPVKKRSSASTTSSIAPACCDKPICDGKAHQIPPDEKDCHSKEDGGGEMFKWRHCDRGGKGCCGKNGHGEVQHDLEASNCVDTCTVSAAKRDDCCGTTKGAACCTEDKVKASLSVQEKEAIFADTSDRGKHSGLANVSPFSWSRETSRIDNIEKARAETCKSECCSGGPAADCEKRFARSMGRVLRTISNEVHDIGDDEQAGHSQHILLNVQGMTCTGCENKLVRALQSIPGVTNIKTSFLNSRADFDLDECITKAEDAVERVHTMTGFQVARLQSLHQSVDVMMDKSKARELMLEDIPGLVDVISIDKRTATLNYDPNIIGVRRLLGLACGETEKLAPPKPNTALSDSRRLLRTMGIKTLVATLLTIPVVVLAWASTDVDERVKSIVSLVLATLVQGIAVTEFYKNAFRALWHDRSVELDTLVVISITAAYVYSVVAFGFLMIDRSLDTKEFFETSTLLISLVLLGRLIATYARSRAVKAVSMRSLQATKAILIRDKEVHTEIDTRLLQFGDRFLVQPHTRIPTDGEVIEGRSEVDESMVTGESMPVIKSTGDDLIAGTVNGDGTLKARLTRLPGKNTVTDIADLVEQANSAKPKVQDLADRVATWFIPVVVFFAIVTFAVQIAASIRLRNQSSGAAAGTAISYAIAVLAVSCPCALGLAVPMVLVITGGVAARAGVIIKSTEATERSWQITDVVFDKTGTLTTPDLEVTDEHILIPDSDQAKAVSLVMTKGNKHPVSVSMARHLAEKCRMPLEAQDVKVIPGCGVEATINGVSAKAGNPAWLSLTNHRAVRFIATSGKTVLCVTLGEVLVAVYGLKTTLRPEASDLIKALQKRNIEVHLISGDSSLAVQSCAETLGIKPANVRSRCTPAEKQAYVLALSSPGCGSSCEDLTIDDDEHEHGHDHDQTTEAYEESERTVKGPAKRKVLFVGDGTNDAIALSSSFVGVQIGTASDVVASTASVSLLGSLHGITYLLDLSKAAYRRIVFNFIWAAIYNVFVILLAAGAFVRIRIEPRWAGLGEIVSVLPVVAAAMTMRRWKREL